MATIVQKFAEAEAALLAKDAELSEVKAKLAVFEAEASKVADQMKAAVESVAAKDAELAQAKAQLAEAVKSSSESVAKVSELEQKLKMAPGHNDVSEGAAVAHAGSVAVEDPKESFRKQYKAEKNPAVRAKMWREFNKVSMLVAVMLCAGIAFAGADQAILSASVTAGTTNTASATIKGEIDNIQIVIPASCTSTVSIATSGGVTLFSKSGMTSGTTTYNVRVPVHNTSGTAQTYTDYTNAVQSVLAPAVVVDTVTATFINNGPATATIAAKIQYIK